MIFYENIIEQEFQGFINGVEFNNKEFYRSVEWILETLVGHFEFKEEFYNNKVLHEITIILLEDIYMSWEKGWPISQIEGQIYTDFTDMVEYIKKRKYNRVMEYLPYISFFNSFFDYFKSYLDLPKLVLVDKRELKDLAFKAFAHDVDQKEREKTKSYKGEIMEYWLKNEYEGVPSINDFIRQLVKEYIVEEE